MPTQRAAGEYWSRSQIPPWFSEQLTHEQLKLSARMLWQQALRMPGNGLKPTARLVAHTLATHMQSDQAVTRGPKVENLTSEAGLKSKGAVCNALKELQLHGWLAVDSGRQHQTSTYTALLPALDPRTPASRDANRWDESASRDANRWDESASRDANRWDESASRLSAPASRLSASSVPPGGTEVNRSRRSSFRADRGAAQRPPATTTRQLADGIYCDGVWHSPEDGPDAWRCDCARRGAAA